MTLIRSQSSFPLIAWLVGCSAAGASAPPGPGEGDDGTPAASTSTAPGTTSMFNPGTLPSQVIVGDEACAAESYAAESLPVDLFIMMDQSYSMNESVPGGSRWSAASAALGSFVGSPRTAGINAGIQYFGLSASATPVIPTTTTGCGNPWYCPPPGGTYGPSGYGGWNSSCNAADYSVADVEIAPLPGNGASIVASIRGHQPSSDTPTQPALEGAIAHATTWAAAHPGHPNVVVLVTDGEPFGCNSTVTGVEQVAARGLAANPSIRTFVIGVGEELTSLHAIARAGGTNEAFILNTTQDVTAQFLDALDAIRGNVVVPCEYRIPAPSDGTEMADLNKINVAHTPSVGSQAGSPSTLFQVADATQCAANGGGWYYDNPASPTKIHLCGETCGAVTADAGSVVSVLVGCVTQHAPIQ